MARNGMQRLQMRAVYTARMLPPHANGGDAAQQQASGIAASHTASPPPPGIMGSLRARYCSLAALAPSHRWGMRIRCSPLQLWRGRPPISHMRSLRCTALGVVHSMYTLSAPVPASIHDLETPASHTAPCTRTHACRAVPD